MDDDAARWTSVAVEEVLHDATFAKCMKTFCDGGGVDEEATTKGAFYVGKELVEREFNLIQVATC